MTKAGLCILAWSDDQDNSSLSRLAERAVTRSSPGRIKRRKNQGSFRGKGGTPGNQKKTPPVSIDIPAEKLGFPGSFAALYVVPQFPDASRSDNDILMDLSEREFETAALLSKTPNLNASPTASFTPDDGDSYFVFTPPSMAVDTHWGTVKIWKNDRSEAAMVEMTCVARSPVDALDRLQLACATFLDLWAYIATAPVYLKSLRARDLSSQAQMIWISVPFQQTEIAPSALQIPTPLRPILALYREGLGSASPIYKFLCFYKILEGYLKKIKPDLARLFREAGLSYPAPADKVPDHPDLVDEFKPFVGQSITKFKDHLTPGFRDAVAHFEKDGLSPLVMSNPKEVVRFSNSALAVELCARTVIESFRLAFHAAIEAGLDLSGFAEKGDDPHDENSGPCPSTA